MRDLTDGTGPFNRVYYSPAMIATRAALRHATRSPWFAVAVIGGIGCAYLTHSRTPGVWHGYMLSVAVVLTAMVLALLYNREGSVDGAASGDGSVDGNDAVVLAWMSGAEGSLDSEPTWEQRKKVTTALTMMYTRVGQLAYLNGLENDPYADRDVVALITRFPSGDDRRTVVISAFRQGYRSAQGGW